MKIPLPLLPILACLVACSTLPQPGRQFLDSSTRADNPPEWVRTSKTSWETKGLYYIKAAFTVRGDERVNGCFDLARLDAKEKLLSEIASEVRGSLDNAQQSISENAENVLGKVRSAEFSGRVVGLRFAEEYFERYRVADTERVECHVLAAIKPDDYQHIKRGVIDKVAAVDPRLRDAIAKKQIQFFDRHAAPNQNLITKTADETEKE